MDLTIEHETVYTYDQPLYHSVQTVRLTPREHDGQRVERWTLKVNERESLARFTDSFHNIVHSLTVHGPHVETRIKVIGHVRTADTGGVLKGLDEPLDPMIFLRATPQTKPDAALRDLAWSVGDSLRGDRLDALHRLMNAVRAAVDYAAGTTHVKTTAAEALAQGYGVCQDHAHVFVACCRVLGIPARYVSGYMWAGDPDDTYEASHAWAEAHVPDLGWVGFDVANDVCPGEAYVRVACGLDYGQAAPVRGVRRGGGGEALRVNVVVAQAQQ